MREVTITTLLWNFSWEMYISSKQISFSPSPALKRSSFSTSDEGHFCCSVIAKQKKWCHHMRYFNRFGFLEWNIFAIFSLILFLCFPATSPDLIYSKHHMLYALSEQCTIWMEGSMYDVIGTNSIGLYYFKRYDDNISPLCKDHSTFLYIIPSFSLVFPLCLLDDPVEDACVLCGKCRACLRSCCWSLRKNWITNVRNLPEDVRYDHRYLSLNFAHTKNLQKLGKFSLGNWYANMLYNKPYPGLQCMIYNDW